MSNKIENCTLNNLENIFREIYKRIIIPLYIPLLSLIPFLLFFYSKENNLYFKFRVFTFLAGLCVVIISETSIRFISKVFDYNIILIFIPIILIFFLYIIFLFQFNLKFKKLIMIKVYTKFLILIYLKSLIYVSIVTISLALILNVLSELDFFKEIEVSTYYPLFLSILNSPDLVFEMFPFIFLIATQLFFIKLLENKELDIFKYSGLKNISILKIITTISFLTGLLITLIYYNFSSTFKKHIFRVKIFHIPMMVNILQLSQKMVYGLKI